MVKLDYKIALIKQSVYADLYVGDNNFTPKELLLNSNERVGPIGLISELNADYFIVNTCHDKECSIWKDVYPYHKDQFAQLPHKSINQINGHEYKQPLNKIPQGNYAQDVESIRWSDYDIIISINCAIPFRIVKRFPRILWCYMISEADIYMDKVYFGYDVSLNQLCRGSLFYDNPKIIDFPYTFVNQNTLEDIFADSYMQSKKGIYAEINMVQERPVKKVPILDSISRKTGHPILLHSQSIKENLRKIYSAKYFVKVGGRRTRGNSVIESISLGTPVLMSPSKLIHSQLLPEEAWVESISELEEKIMLFEENNEEYCNLLKKQKNLLKQFVFDYPLESLISALDRKREKKEVPKFSMPIRKRSYARRIIRKMMSYFDIS